MGEWALIGFQARDGAPILDPAHFPTYAGELSISVRCGGVPLQTFRTPEGVMPTVLRTGPYRFFFYAGDRDEAPHVHVERDDGCMTL